MSGFFIAIVAQVFMMKFATSNTAMNLPSTLSLAKASIAAAEKTVRDAFDTEIASIMPASGPVRFVERVTLAKYNVTRLLSSVCMENGRPGFAYTHYNPTADDKSDLLTSDDLAIDELPGLAVKMRNVLENAAESA